jgi:hypothetical protein
VRLPGTPVIGSDSRSLSSNVSSRAAGADPGNGVAIRRFGMILKLEIDLSKLGIDVLKLRIPVLKLQIDDLKLRIEVLKLQIEDLKPEIEVLKLQIDDLRL